MYSLARLHIRVWLIVAALLGPHVALSSDIDPTKLPPSSQKKIVFRDDIYPILEKRCFACHRGAQAPSGHRLDVRAEILGEPNGRPLAIKGKSADSRLIHMVSGLLKDKIMPPSGERLSGEQVSLLRAWIDQGLDWDDKLLPPPNDGARHWSFQPVRKPEIPVVKIKNWVRTPVDAFIAAEMEKRGLAPAPEASRTTLIRRVTLDLTGLPPTSEEIELFLNDIGPGAYERLVERLLSSPHYGERWGRHWLDVARWADTEGYEYDYLRPFAWRYRDYVVTSFNDDRPFDQFIRQQIAGDELLPYSDENLIATGFLAAARFSSNEEDKSIQRNDALVDIVNATSSAFLGLTLGCAQCHNHKFDPLTQKDYYSFQGFFVQGQMDNVTLKNSELWKQYESRIPPALAPARELQRTLLEEGRKKLLEKTRNELSAEMQAALALLEDQRTAEQKELAKKAQEKLDLKDNDVEKSFSEDDRKFYDELKKKIQKLEEENPKPQTFGFHSASAPTSVEVLPMKAMFPLAYKPEDLKNARPHILIRGNVHNVGPEVDIAWPAILGPTPKDVVEKAPRSALADWLTASSNPLTSRVWANRVWQYHFGQGLTKTPGDFGFQGDKPSHPELLDYLASQLMENGWSTKHLHRLIVNSATYRQSSRFNADNAKIDSDNRYLWRWTARRLEAETIRDSLLVISNELDLKIGGPSVALMVDDDKFKTDVKPLVESGTPLRRSLYLEQRRDYPPPMQSFFDGPRSTESCARRHVSTVALQPLFLLNSEFVTDRAKAFAERIASIAGDDRDRQIEVAFRFVLSRPPDEEERKIVLALFEDTVKPAVPAVEPKSEKQRDAPHSKDVPTPLVHFCHIMLNLNEFLYLD